MGAAGFAAAQDQERAISIAREVERLASQRVLWPGFDPLSIPLAVYTGERTYLFRHPTPPDGFSPVAGEPSATSVSRGRYPAVTSNSSADIGGTLSATLLADGLRTKLSPTELATVALHEAFHVYQRRKHPAWSADEGSLFLYPTDDGRLLGLRRLESEALRRALAAAQVREAACWARLAMAARRDRFTEMASAFSAYERQTELNEGLAAYIQLLAAGRTTIEIPPAEFRAGEVRARAYVIGPALALLLDRLKPGWPASLEADDTQYLDRILESAISTDAGSWPRQCGLTADEIAGIERTARDGAKALITVRGERRRSFDARPGWRVTVLAAEGQPLWPQGFDPLNVERVEGGFLHTRFLRLGNDAGELQALDEEGADVEALTDGLGPHPVFNGVRGVIVAGLAKPEIETEDGRTAIRTPGFVARFQGAGVHVSGTDVLVRLGSPK